MWDWMNKILLTCMDATKITVRKSFHALSFKEKLQLRLHHMVCHACRKFDSQNEFIDHAMEQHYKVQSEDQNLKLSTERKKAIQEVIESTHH